MLFARNMWMYMLCWLLVKPLEDQVAAILLNCGSDACFQQLLDHRNRFVVIFMNCSVTWLYGILVTDQSLSRREKLGDNAVYLRLEMGPVWSTRLCNCESVDIKCFYYLSFFFKKKAVACLPAIFRFVLSAKVSIVESHVQPAQSTSIKIHTHTHSHYLWRNLTRRKHVVRRQLGTASLPAVIPLPPVHSQTPGCYQSPWLAVLEGTSLHPRWEWAAFGWTFLGWTSYAEGCGKLMSIYVCYMHSVPALDVPMSLCFFHSVQRRSGFEEKTILNTVSVCLCFRLPFTYY